MWNASSRAMILRVFLPLMLLSEHPATGQQLHELNDAQSILTPAASFGATPEEAALLRMVWETQDSHYYAPSGLMKAFLLRSDGTMIVFDYVQRAVRKLSRSGEHLWTANYGGSYHQEGPYSRVIEVAAIRERNDKLYMTGWTCSPSDIATDSSSLQGPLDAFIACFDADSGRLLWAKYYGGEGLDTGRDIALDSEGHIFLVGCTRSDHGISTDTSLSRRGASYILKLDSMGTKIWGRYFTSGYYSEIRSVVVNADGDVLLCGSAPPVAFTNTIPSTAPGTGFLVCLASLNGAVKWCASHGDDYRDLKLASDNSIIVAGRTGMLSGFGTDSSRNRGGLDASLISFSSTGKIQWATYYGGSYDEDVGTIAIDTQGKIYLVGFTGSPNLITIGGTPPGIHAKLTYLAVFESMGRLLWADYHPMRNGNVVVIDESGYPVIVGLYQKDFFWAVALDVSTGVLGVQQHVASQPASLAISSMYPTPAGSTAMIAITTEQSREVSIMIVDVLGRVVGQVPARLFPSGTTTIPLPVTNLPNGCYRVCANSHTSAVSKPLIIMR